MKKLMRQSLSVLLCLALLLSGLAVAGIGAVAEDTNTVAEDYYIEIDVSIINCDNGYSADRPFLGPDVKNPGSWFGGGDTFYKDQGGMVIWYTDKNGRGETVNTETIDFGPNGLNYVYNGGPASEHTISGTLTGFPTSFAVYNNNDHNAILGSGDVEWAVTAMRVGTDDKHMSTIWQGDCHVKNRDGAKPSRYKVDVNGAVRVWSVEGIGDSDIETNDYTYVKNSKGAYVMNKTDYASYTENAEPWELPYADSLLYFSDNQEFFADSLEIVNDESSFSPQSVAYCIDQYGVKISEPYEAYDITQYNGESYTEYATVDQSYIQTAGDIRFDQKTGVIYAGNSGYIAGDAAAHPLTARLTYTFGAHSLECYSTTEIVYPQREVTWQYYIGTYEGAAQVNTIKTTALFGNTLTDADYPGEAATRNYFEGEQHYEGGSFEDFRVTENTAVQMQDYTVGTHTLNTYMPIEGDAQFHNRVCACGYVRQQAHDLDEGVITEKPACEKSGILTKTCTLCGAAVRKEISALEHEWDEGVITVKPSCGVSGVKTYTCTKCSQTKTEPIKAPEHDPVLHESAPLDKINGQVYYQCENCGRYWGAVYNESTRDYDIPDEEPLDSLEQALALSDTLPAPFFNIFKDEVNDYDYSTRGAALRYVNLKTPDYQPLRFTASVRVPERVSVAIGDSGNCIQDVGIVYSQTKRIANPDDFVIGAKDVYKMSVKEKNAAPVYDGTNWGGITKHEAQDGTHLSFNLVVNVLPENWKEEYCARAYIIYRFNGVEYTVYDEAFSARSVEYIARQVVANPNESQQAREYCQNVILDNLFE